MTPQSKNALCIKLYDDERGIQARFDINDKWIMVEILDDLSRLSVQHGGEFLKDNTDRIMSTTYKVPRTFVERASSATSDEDVALIRAEIALALDQFEKQVGALRVMT